MIYTCGSGAGAKFIHRQCQLLQHGVFDSEQLVFQFMSYSRKFLSVGYFRYSSSWMLNREISETLEYFLLSHSNIIKVKPCLSRDYLSKYGLK